MVGRLVNEEESMMGPIMQEDEYTINVKLRRPVNSSCAFPPVISLDANNTSVFVSPPDNATIMHAHATKMVNGMAEPILIGGATLPRRIPALKAPMSTELPRINDTQSLPRKRIMEGKGHIVLDMHNIDQESAPQRPPPPSMPNCKALVPVRKASSPTRTENGITHGCLQLPIVQIFAEDSSLVAKNNFKAPMRKTDNDGSRMLAVPNKNKVVESGSLFVPRIPEHFRGDGELYVPPVEEQSLKTLKKVIPVVRGNSKRNRNKQSGSLPIKNGMAFDKSTPSIVFESVPPSPSEKALSIGSNQNKSSTVIKSTKPKLTLNTMSPGSLSVIPTSQPSQSSNVIPKDEIQNLGSKNRQTRPHLKLNTTSHGSLLMSSPPTISPDITPKTAPETPPRFIVKNLTPGFSESNSKKQAPPPLKRSSSKIATARAHLSGMLNQHMERNPTQAKYSNTLPRRPSSPKPFTHRTKSSPLPNINSQPYSPTRAIYSPAFLTQVISPDTPPVSKRIPDFPQPLSPEPPPRTTQPWFKLSSDSVAAESPPSEIQSPIDSPMSSPPISAEDSGIMPSFTQAIQIDSQSPTSECTSMSHISSPDWTIDYVSPRGSVFYTYKGDASTSNSSEDEDSSSATTTPSSPDYPDDLGERVVEVYGGHGYPGHATTTTPVTNGRSAHSTRSQVVDPSQLTSLDFENEGTPHTMLVQDPPSPADSHDLNHNHNHIRLKPAGNSSKYLVHESGSSDGEDNYGYDGSLHNGLGLNMYARENYGYDPGYSSERSPEEEEGPPIFRSSSSRSPSISPHPSERPASLMLAPGEVLSTQQLQRLCPFIRESTSFEVTVVKNLRGLGLAVTGGVECEVPWAGLIRIKKLYPQTPAWLCGQLKIGDIVLTANSQPLTGLTSHEALEVLRTAGSEVTMQVCRPDSEDMDGGSDVLDGANCGIMTVVSTSLTAPTQTHNLLSPSPSLSSYGEFEVSLTKVKGSLGFTLRKNDNSILGHTIRSLVKEPAISNTSMRAGDKIISVNNQDMCSLTHEEAIAFLRTCPETVTLKLYRDAMQTPVSPVSPTEPEVLHKPKPLRKEARDMLEDLAFRKQSPCQSPSLNNTSSPGTPRRRRLQKTPSPDLKSVDRWDSLVRKTCEDSSLPGSPNLDSQLSLKSIQESDYEDSPFPDSCYNDAVSQSRTSSASSNSYSTSENTKPKRPNFLDLSHGHSCSRKTQFTPPHERDQSFPPSPSSPQYPSHHLHSQTPVHALTSTHSDTQPTFVHHNPGYSSVNLGDLPHSGGRSMTNTTSDHNLSGNHRVEATDGTSGSGLLKWKGVVFTPEEECPSSEHHSSDEHSEYIDEIDNVSSLQNDIVTINLNRGWNSRLGFSLQPQDNGHTTITAIYAESVAAKDGRLRAGDRVVRVNGINCEEMTTEEIIDILRKTRGNIGLGVLQQSY